MKARTQQTREKKAMVYQIYNETTGKVHVELNLKASVRVWLKRNTVWFLAPEYGYFPAAGERYRVIDKKNDFDVTGEFIK
ncbi:MAG: hypothetical protein LBH60_04860 [Prevotellaceae bacterium]|jgi:hypothetical protein|nr:hypothetical protein [Prevotellaceae bacterium]